MKCSDFTRMNTWKNLRAQNCLSKNKPCDEYDEINYFKKYKRLFLQSGNRYNQMWSI